MGVFQFLELSMFPEVSFLRNLVLVTCLMCTLPGNRGCNNIICWLGKFKQSNQGWNNGTLIMLNTGVDTF